MVTVGGGGSNAAATPAQPAGTKGASKAVADATKAAGGSVVTAKKKGTAPPTKAVTYGSSGTGPGYQSGHFTGNFFGGGP